MADISKVTTLDGTTYNIKDSTARLGLPYGVCTTNSSTATKEVTINSVTELVEGLTIAVKFENQNNASSPKLKLNDFDAKDICQYGSTSAGNATDTTGWRARSVVHLTYDGTYWLFNKGQNTNTTYTQMTVSDVEAGSSGTYMVTTPIILKSGSMKWGTALSQGIIAAENVTYGHVIVGTSSGYMMANSNITFDLKYPILYVRDAFNSGSPITNCCTQGVASLQIGSSGWYSSVSGGMVYLVGTIDSSKQFTINSPVFTQTIPTEEDNLYYIPIGISASRSTTVVAFCPRNELWAYKNGVFCNVTTETIYTANTSNLATTTVPNVTSVGSAPTLGTAIPADDITSWTTNTPTSFTVTGEKLTITSGTAASLSYTEKSIPNVTSVGSAPTLGTAITVATGSLASDGGGGTVVTGITGS